MLVWLRRRLGRGSKGGDDDGSPDFAARILVDDAGGEHLVDTKELFCEPRVQRAAGPAGRERSPPLFAQSSSLSREELFHAWRRLHECIPRTHPLKTGVGSLVGAVTTDIENRVIATEEKLRDRFKMIRNRLVGNGVVVRRKFALAGRRAQTDDEETAPALSTGRAENSNE